MRIGIDCFTIRELQLDAYKSIDYINKLGFEGVQFGGVRGLSQNLDHGELQEIAAYATSQGMYSHVSVTSVNPVIATCSFDELRDCLVAEIAAAAAAGWHELHSAINCGDERYNHPIPWPAHVQQSTELIKSLRPVLEQFGSRIDLETHGETTFDILRVIEGAGSDITGVCLDTANTLVNAEDPVLAAKRVAPYTHLTHTKDGIIYFSENGITRQGKPPGQGVVDWEQVLAILGEYSPDLPLSIEDHKWFFEAKIFDKQWMEHNPELTPYELGQFIKLAWQTEKKLAIGEIPNVEEYETIDYLEQMEERLLFGRNYLRAMLSRLGLANNSGF